jgi:hypothetical protein
MFAAGPLIALLYAAPASAQTATDLCFAQAREQAKIVLEGGGSREAARFVLEREVIPCVRGDADEKLVHLLAVAHFDRALFARELFARTLTLAHYQAIAADRQAKLRKLLEDPAGQQELLEGDADRDMVPDARDRCPDTPYGVPTDENGCPVAIPPGSRTEEDQWRRLMDNTTRTARTRRRRRRRIRSNGDVARSRSTARSASTSPWRRWAACPTAASCSTRSISSSSSRPT